MKQVSYSGKYSLLASRAHQSNIQFSFVVGNACCPHFLHVELFNYRRESIPTTKENCRWDWWALLAKREDIYHYKKLVSYFYVLYSQICISVP